MRHVPYRYSVYTIRCYCIDSEVVLEPVYFDEYGTQSYCCCFCCQCRYFSSSANT